MKEEQVTKSIMRWLNSNGWEIVIFDFPQSGTGRLLHPNNREGEKNKNCINPDIVAVKGKICLFFENKDRFYYNDYLKQNEMITNNNYSQAIDELLSNYSVESIYYGIGLPSKEQNKKAIEKTKLVDFVVGVNDEKKVEILYCKDNFLI